MLKKLIFTSSLVLGLFTVSAFAQQTETPKNNPNQDQNQTRKQNGNGGGRGRQGNKQFTKLDLNHDGFISKEEWTRNEKAFDRIDTNHDGQISKDEMEFARQEKGGKGENVGNGGQGNNGGNGNTRKPKPQN